MDDLFPHLGETVLERIVLHDPSLLLNQLDIPPSELIGVHRQVPMVFPNTELIFDGFSTIDLALELANETVVPIEVKLGRTGLSRAVVNRKLSPCRISSHRHGARVSGQILAVLNRYFDSDLSTLIGDDRLCAVVANRPRVLTDRWAVVARKPIIASWDRFPPKFNGHQCFISVESLCRHFGRDAFNELVESMLGEFDFFDTWIGSEN